MSIFKTLFNPASGDYKKYRDKRNKYIAANAGPPPPLHPSATMAPGEWNGAPDMEGDLARQAYMQKVKALEQQWLQSLPPAEASKAANAFRGYSGSIDKVNKVGKYAALGVIGAAGAGAALTGAGVIGGGSGATGAMTGGVNAANYIVPGSGMSSAQATAQAIAAAGGSGSAGGQAIMNALATGATTPAALTTAVNTAAVTGNLGVELAKLGLAGIGTLAGYGAQKGATDAANKATNAAQSSADAAAQLGRDNLDFTKQQYADALPYREAAAKTAQQVSEAQLAQMKQQEELAREYADYNRTTFRPLEQGIVSDAQNYDTPEKRNAAAIAAQADVNKGFAAVNSAAQRRMAASGIDPGSMRAMSAMQGQDVQQANANAGAAYTARKGIETTGFARKMDAASLGRNLPSSQATTAGLGLIAGNNATGNAGAALNAVNTGVPQVQNAYNSAVQGNAVGGNLYSNAAQLAQRAGVISADQWGALGNSLGQWSNSQGGNALLNRWFGTGP